MVDFASDPLRGFAAGMRLGDAMRTRNREDEQRQAYGQAFQQGGFGAVGKVAGGMGDLETAGAAQGQVQEQQESELEHARQGAQVLQRVHNSLRELTPEQRRERLTQMAPQLEQFGVDQDTILNLDTSDAKWDAFGQELGAAVGQFQRFQDIRQVQGVGLVGINPDGSHEVLEPEHAPAITPYQQAQLEIMRGRGGRGAAPAGYEWTPDGRQRAIEGGPADYRQSNEARARAGALESSELQLANAIEAIDQAAQVLGRNNDWWNPLDDSTGMQGQVLRGIGGTNARDLDQALEPVRATLSFSALQEMRRNSATGGALGSIAVRELELLGNTLRSLDTAQSQEQLEQAIVAVRAQMVRTVEAFRRAREEITGGGATTEPPPQQEAPEPSQPSGGFDLENMSLDELMALREAQARGQ